MLSLLATMMTEAGYDRAEPHSGNICLEHGGGQKDDGMVHGEGLVVILADEPDHHDVHSHQESHNLSLALEKCQVPQDDAHTPWRPACPG